MTAGRGASDPCVLVRGCDQVFTGRAALLHLGAFTAMIMAANLFLIIMPN